MMTAFMLSLLASQDPPLISLFRLEDYPRFNARMHT